MSEEIDITVAEAKKSFSLADRLKGRNLREDSITVYTDEVAGLKLGWAKDEKNGYGLLTGKRERVGILGDIDAILAVDPDTDITELRDLAVEAQMELELSGLTFHLRAVPELITKKARRAAMKAYGVNGKIPDENVLDFNSEYNANLFADTIFKIVDPEGAEETGKLSPEAARDLEDYLPRSEYAKLYAKLQDVQFRQAVGDSVTSEPSF